MGTQRPEEDSVKTRKENGHMETWAEVGVTLSQVEEGPGATRSRKKQGHTLPQRPRGRAAPLTGPSALDPCPACLRDDLFLLC